MGFFAVSSYERYYVEINIVYINICDNKMQKLVRQMRDLAHINL